MQILIAFVVMGLIGAVAVVLAATAALIRVAPLLIAVVVMVGAVRCWERRRLARRGPRAPAPPRPPAVPAPAPPAARFLSRPSGWVLVPVWIDPAGRAHRRPVIDAEVISVEEHHG
jgi:hypothetical protein